MSQNAESARDWINREQPNRHQLESALTAIQRKLLEHPQLTAQAREDLQGAASAVQEELELVAYSEETDHTLTESSPAVDLTPLGSHAVASENTDLDLSSLGQDADPTVQALKGKKKRQAFEQLKANIGLKT